ncbi:hypothetical protein BGX38DRAFT_1275442 [Terfezia claveryi]|nr:hypothetical protein BGX38DRAFT_1275442 [Terfezia claveryi]
MELGLRWASWGTGAVVCCVVGGLLGIYQEEIFGQDEKMEGEEALGGGMGNGDTEREK